MSYFLFLSLSFFLILFLLPVNQPNVKRNRLCRKDLSKKSVKKNENKKQATISSKMRVQP